MLSFKDLFIINSDGKAALGVARQQQLLLRILHHSAHQERLRSQRLLVLLRADHTTSLLYLCGERSVEQCDACPPHTPLPVCRNHHTLPQSHLMHRSWHHPQKTHSLVLQELTRVTISARKGR
jgi:hypothetical protein